jgi:hypothetical protein
MLLQQRLETIGNHSMRDLRPDLHLAALQKVSEEIDAFRKTWSHAMDARLRHFLTNASFAKALEWISRDESTAETTAD